MGLRSLAVSPPLEQGPLGLFKNALAEAAITEHTRADLDAGDARADSPDVNGDPVIVAGTCCEHGISFGRIDSDVIHAHLFERPARGLAGLSRFRREIVTQGAIGVLGITEPLIGHRAAGKAVKQQN